MCTADNIYELYVNGRQAVRTRTGWREAEGVAVNLEPAGTGRPNVFAIIASNTDVEDNPFPNAAGLLVTIQIAYDDGSISIIHSSPDWRVSKDITLGWETQSLDDSGIGWAPAAVVGIYGDQVRLKTMFCE